MNNIIVNLFSWIPKDKVRDLLAYYFPGDKKDYFLIGVLLMFLIRNVFSITNYMIGRSFSNHQVMMTAFLVVGIIALLIEVRDHITDKGSPDGVDGVYTILGAVTQLQFEFLIFK